MSFRRGVGDDLRYFIQGRFGFFGWHRGETAGNYVKNIVVGHGSNLIHDDQGCQLFMRSVFG
jgi:hypothetical protein